MNRNVSTLVKITNLYRIRVMKSGVTFFKRSYNSAMSNGLKTTNNLSTV